MSEEVSVRRALAQSGLVPLEGQVLLAHVLGVERAWLVAHATEAIEPSRAAAFFALARRRRDGEPVAYLTGWREFYGLRLAVTPDVLIPRPETETLVEAALARLPADRDARVLDLGTGSGAIALALARERPRVQVVATDRSPEALAVARGNAEGLGLANVTFVAADWYQGVPPGRFDVIASNPPYVAAADPHLADGDLRHEPQVALVAGAGGLAAIRTIVAGAPGRLVPGGWIVIEHGYDQQEHVRELVTEAGGSEVTGMRDLAGIARVVAARFV